MSDTTADQIVKRLQALRSLRTRHESTWRECYDYTFPIRGEEFVSSSPDAATALRGAARMMDNTLADSAMTLAASFLSGMTPSSSVWCEMDVDGASDDEKRWLSNAAETVWANIHAANYDAAGFECALDAVVAGWFVLYVDQDRERGGLTFEQWPLGQCHIASSKPGGRVDTIIRSFKLTAEQAAHEYGLEALSEKTRELVKNKPDTPVEFALEIKPRRTWAVGARLARNLPFSAVVVEVAERKAVKESGYHEFPCVVPRWWLIPGSPYATGQVLTALPNARQLNQLLLNETLATDLAVAGMWIAEDDGVLNPKTIKVGPRKVIVANSVDSMKPLLTGSDFNVSFSKGEDLRRAIRKSMMVTYLEPRDGPAVTATQAHIEVGMLRQLLGPIYGRMQAEWLAPMVERCFGLIYRAGVLPPPPESLAGRLVQIRYKSPVARAQMLEDVAAVERLMLNAEQMAQVKPEVLDLIDGDEAVRVVADGLGVPQKVVRDQRRVQMLREARAEQQAQQAKAEQAQQAQGAMVDAMAKRTAAAA